MSRDPGPRQGRLPRHTGTVRIPEEPCPEPVPGHVAIFRLSRADRHIPDAVRQLIGCTVQSIPSCKLDGDLIQDIRHIDELPIRGHRAFGERHVADVL